MTNFFELKTINDVKYANYADFKGIEGSLLDRILGLATGVGFSLMAVMAPIAMIITAISMNAWWAGLIGTIAGVCVLPLGVKYLRDTFKDKNFKFRCKLKKDKQYNRIKQLMKDYEKTENFNIEKTEYEIEYFTKKIEEENAKQPPDDYTIVFYKHEIEKRQKFLKENGVLQTKLQTNEQNLFDELTQTEHKQYNDSFVINNKDNDKENKTENNLDL